MIFHYIDTNMHYLSGFKKEPTRLEIHENMPKLSA